MKLGFVEKVGSIGSIIAAAACPACFPLLAVVGAALGLGVLRPLEGTVFLVFQVLVGVALVGNIISFLNHRGLLSLIVGIISPLLIFFSVHVFWNSFLLYLGLFGLMVASILNFIANRRCKTCIAVKKNE